MFRDRAEAGRRLAEALDAFRDARDVLVLGIPRGGVVVAAQVARALGLPLDVMVVRKIGAPGNPEYAAGAVDEDGNISVNPSAQVDREHLEAEGRRQVAEIARRVADFRSGKPPLALDGRIALLVDDGIATGQTLIAAIASARARGASQVVIAAPVAAPDTVRRLREFADDVVVLDTPRWFAAVGEFYRDFPQTEDAEVKALLAEAEDGAVVSSAAPSPPRGARG